MGLDLFKSKKSSSHSSPLGPAGAENVHQLRLLHNRLIQWQYANAKADAANLNMTSQTEIRPLETWGDMERRHSLAISKTTESLQSIVSRLPLIEGAEAEPQSTSFALRHALDLTTSIKSAITDISPSGDGTVPLLSELAKVVGQEKLLLEECLECLRTISKLESPYNSEEIQQADQAIVDELKQISEREVEMEDLQDHGEKDGGRGGVQGVEDLRMEKEARRAHLREQVIGEESLRERSAMKELISENRSSACW
ncbi:hypothetical protein NL676_017518 [Syzygium grande]|nr:hypothetical protein NL676_017518 [Syzygium grande]